AGSLTPTITRRSKLPACTGTSSTSSGFFSSPCSTSSAVTSRSEAFIMSDGQGHFGHAHIAPASMYYAVFAALIVGTILTVLAAKVDMGLLNNGVMLLIGG